MLSEIPITMMTMIIIIITLNYSLVRGDVFAHILGRIGESHSIGLAIVFVALRECV